MAWTQVERDENYIIHPYKQVLGRNAATRVRHFVVYRLSTRVRESRVPLPNTKNLSILTIYIYIYRVYEVQHILSQHSVGIYTNFPKLTIYIYIHTPKLILSHPYGIRSYKTERLNPGFAINRNKLHVVFGIYLYNSKSKHTVCQSKHQPKDA